MQPRRPVARPSGMLHRRWDLFAALLLATLVGACGTPKTSPPDQQDPAAVLSAWFADLARGDCDAARALETDPQAARAEGLCGAIGTFATPTAPAHPRFGEVVYGMRITLTRGLDGGLPPGTMTWFTTLRLQADGTWHVADGGTGP